VSDWPALLAWGLAGYLVGSISFARLVLGRVRPGHAVGIDDLAFGADGTQVAVRGVSATSVSIRAGRRWGFLVVLLDAGKVAAVALAAREISPGPDAGIVAATAAVTGYTDGTEKTGKGMDLDRRRAEAVRDYLVSRHGIDASRITTEAKGTGTRSANVKLIVP